ncbi:hypothetical protein LCGC14_2809010 [marine sediment metagenome]|uniref:Uncharacterized protein n=1 Tax=marine sediment metagenome TaxID=412755 RepID=A0A0F9ATZ0_9ZZZZ
MPEKTKQYRLNVYYPDLKQRKWKYIGWLYSGDNDEEFIKELNHGGKLVKRQCQKKSV